jgi:hypothetical protein
MRWSAEPDRLVDALRAPEDLVLAIRTARTAGPSAAELQLLAARLNLAPAPPPSTPPARRLAMRGTSVARGLTVLAIAACGLLAGLRLLTPEPPARVETPAPVMHLPSLEAAPADPSGLAREPAAAERVASETAPVASALTESTPRIAHASQAPSTEVSASYESEARLLRGARAVLKSDPSRALALAGEHERRFATGQLVEEREVIAMTALVRLERVAEASSRWERFRARFPESVYAPRLSALFAHGDTSNEKTRGASPLTP